MCTCFKPWNFSAGTFWQAYLLAGTAHNILHTNTLTAYCCTDSIATFTCMATAGIHNILQKAEVKSFIEWLQSIVGLCCHNLLILRILLSLPIFVTSNTAILWWSHIMMRRYTSSMRPDLTSELLIVHKHIRYLFCTVYIRLKVGKLQLLYNDNDWLTT